MLEPENPRGDDQSIRVWDLEAQILLQKVSQMKSCTMLAALALALSLVPRAHT
jgi:hypothetical protein